MAERWRRKVLCVLVFVGFVALGVVVPRQTGLDSLPTALSASVADLTAAGRLWAMGATAPAGGSGPAASAAAEPTQAIAAPVSTTVATTTTTPTAAAPLLPTDVARPLACLRMTTPSVELAYPSDAEAHFHEVHTALARWLDFAERQFLKDMKNKYHCGEGFCGPWIENLWIAHCNKTWSHRTPGTRLSDVFGPYVPLLVPFVDLWVANVFEYEAMIAAFKAVARPSVPYVALLQHDTGLVSSREKLFKIMKELPNLLVLSAGGYGHVPIPLLKQPEPLSKFAKPMAKREYLVSYMGSPRNGPLRGQMIQTVKDTAAKMGIKKKVFVGKSNNWRAVMGNSRASLCPRGYGRTAFHLFEALQMGLVPVHVYHDIPWVPYPDVYSDIGFSTDVKRLPALLLRLHNMSDAELERREERVRELRDSHFSTSGVIDQALRFLTGRAGGGDLRCQRLPASMN